MNVGIVNIGNGSGSNNDIEYAAAGNPEINISGGSLNVDGQIRRNIANTLGSLWFSQSGGTVKVKGNNLNTSRGVFEIVNSGSTLNLSGGNLIIEKAGSTTYADIQITPQSSTVNNSNGGHTLIIGDATTPASHVFKLNASAPLWNLIVDGTTQNKTAILNGNTLSLLNNLTINGNGIAGTGSVFNANELNVTIGGSLTNNNLSSATGAGRGRPARTRRGDRRTSTARRPTAPRASQRRRLPGAPPPRCSPRRTERRGGAGPRGTRPSRQWTPWPTANTACAGCHRRRPPGAFPRAGGRCGPA